ALIDVFTDVNATAASKEVIDVATELMDEYLGEEEVALVNEGVRVKEEQRDAALGRFSGEVEWGRHESLAGPSRGGVRDRRRLTPAQLAGILEEATCMPGSARGRRGRGARRWGWLGGWWLGGDGLE